MRYSLVRFFRSGVGRFRLVLSSGLRGYFVVISPYLCGSVDCSVHTDSCFMGSVYFIGRYRLGRWAHAHFACGCQALLRSANPGLKRHGNGLSPALVDNLLLDVSLWVGRCSGQTFFPHVILCWVVG